MLEKLRNKKEEDLIEYEIEKNPTTRYEAEYNKGLTTEQVREHKEDGWSNITVDPPAKTTEEIVRENVFTYFNLIFLVLAILLTIVGSFRNLTFLPVIIFNSLIGIVQELRAKKTLENLTMLNAPKAMVVRNGKKQQVDSESLVLDDVVIFKAGNQICADAEVIYGSAKVNESLLTGESDEIEKSKGDSLMSGSFVAAGECYARLTAVGADSYISKLTLEAKASQQGEQSEMIRSLDRLVKLVGFCLIPIGLALFLQSFIFLDESFKASIVSMVAAVLGMIPEGLYLLASVALAVSSMRLAKQKVLLHDMKSIETLARVDVLCVDKTGTITDNTMQVKKLVATRNYKKGEMPSLKKMLGDYAGAMGDDNITMVALKKFFKEGNGWKPVSTSPFSSALKYSGVTYKDRVQVLGAPEFVLGDDYEKYAKSIEKYASKGYRVLVFGDYDGELCGKALTEKLTPLAYVLLANPVRKEAPETFSYFADQGVEIKVISGDNPVTVSEVAKEAGIQGADKYVDAATLKTEEDLAEAVKKYVVFGRVTPDQKRQFVRALKQQGRTVAMTGDGVNDVLALKDADCSVAMASGSDAAVQAAQVVLLESDFSKMPSVVMEGRRVVNNIQRSASLFLVKNIFSFLLSLFSVLWGMSYPLEPSQVSLISMFTIGVPGFLLAFQPNKDRIEGNFLANVFLKALPAGLTDVIMVAALAVFGAEFGVDSVSISTACTMLLLIVGFIILYNVCSPINIFRGSVWGFCLLGCIACCIVIPQLFAITGMSKQCVMLFVVFSVATATVLRYLTLWNVKIQGMVYRLRQNKIDRENKKITRSSNAF